MIADRSRRRGPKKTIHFVSLGCPKNRVDSEVMLGIAARAGYRHVEDPGEAAVIVVNTCGFIAAAKQESIDTILQLCEHKAAGTCRTLVVAGCLSQRYPADLAVGLPEVDHFLGSSDMPKLERVLTGKAERHLVGDPAQWLVSARDPRTLSTRGASAYVKLAEGCNRRCAFCVIPALRGRQRSRTPDDLVAEVERHVSRGVFEVNLVSQDTIAYGRDLPGEDATLTSLVRRLAEIPGLGWLRLHYLYPEALDPELIELMAQHPRVLPYVDMPLQHAADGMLRRMQRGHGGKRLRTLVDRLRTQVPDLVFRTAFIVGHPGETDEEFQELLDFVAWAEFDRVGTFLYSDEEDVPAHAFAGKVTARIARGRQTRLMRLQRGISRRRLRRLVGRDLDVLVEGTSEQHELVMVGRYYGQAPEIDGCVYLSHGDPRPGELCRVRITKTTDYDLLGELDDDDRVGPDTSRPLVAAVPLVVRASDGRRVALRTVV